jgi:sterol desaturase/sphingolipid hydroxylase (fatty acid hydroxylase superfamily)
VSSALGLLVGIVLGVCATWSLRQQTHALLRPNAVTVSPLLWGGLLRLATVGVLLLVLMTWSPVAMVLAAIGYWLGRSTYLVKCHDLL